MKSFLFFLLLFTMGSSSHAITEKKIIDEISLKYVKIHNSSSIYGQLLKKIPLVSNRRQKLLKSNYLKTRLPRVSYNKETSTLEFTNGIRLKALDLAERKFLINGITFTFPEDLRKIRLLKKKSAFLFSIFPSAFAANAPEGCTKRWGVGPRDHEVESVPAEVGENLLLTFPGGLIIFPTFFYTNLGSAYIQGNSCDQQVAEAVAYLRKRNLGIHKLKCNGTGADYGNYQFELELKDSEKIKANMYWGALAYESGDKKWYLETPYGGGAIHKGRLGIKRSYSKQDNYICKPKAFLGVKKRLEPYKKFIDKLYAQGFCYKCKDRHIESILSKATESTFILTKAYWEIPNNLGR